MFEAFSKVTKVRGLGPTCPARTNLATGELQLNMDVWPRLTPAQKRDVVFHEEGHLVLQTLDEEAADRYSLEKQFRAGYSLKTAVAAMADILSPESEEHVNRAWNRLEYARQLDGYRRKKSNSTMCAGNKQCSGCAGCQETQTFANYGILGVCLSKKCREAKNKAKEEKAASKNEARVLLAAQGIKTGLGGIYQSIGNALDGVIGTAKDLAPAVAAIAGAPGAYQGASNNTAADTIKAKAASNPVTDQLNGQAASPVLAQLQAGAPAMSGITQEQLQALMGQNGSDPKNNNTLMIVAAVVVVLIILAVILKN